MDQTSLPQPRIYLCVEGALLRSDNTAPAHFNDHLSPPSRPFSVSMLTQLSLADADLYWLSTEPTDDVPVIFATRLLGCPSLESHVDPTWWKFDALAAAHPHGVPFIWIDPNFGTLRDSQCRFAAEALDSLHSPCLLITPDPAEALSRSELTKVLAFARRYSVVPV